MSEGKLTPSDIRRVLGGRGEGQARARMLTAVLGPPCRLDEYRCQEHRRARSRRLSEEIPNERLDHEATKEYPCTKTGAEAWKNRESATGQKGGTEDEE